MKEEEEDYYLLLESRVILVELGSICPEDLCIGSHHSSAPVRAPGDDNGGGGEKLNISNRTCSCDGTGSQGTPFPFSRLLLSGIG